MTDFHIALALALAILNLVNIGEGVLSVICSYYITIIQSNIDSIGKIV